MLIFTPNFDTVNLFKMMMDDNDNNDDHDDGQEKISISAGGALAFDTVNLLINTFSSLVRWTTMKTTMMMTAPMMVMMMMVMISTT